MQVCMEKERICILENQRPLGSGLYGKTEREKQKAFSSVKFDGTRMKYTGTSCSKIVTDQLGFHLAGK